MAELKEGKVPEGYRLVLRKRLSCPLCQRPELRGEADTAIWCRQFAISHVVGKLRDKFDLEFSMAEVGVHRGHLELVKKVSKEEREDKNRLVKDFIKREGELLGFDTERNKLKLNPANQIDNRIKALSAQLVELELEEWTNDGVYLSKLREWRGLMELKLRKEGELVDKMEISPAVLEVRSIFEELKKLEEEDKRKKEVKKSASDTGHSEESKGSELEKE